MGDDQSGRRAQSKIALNLTRLRQVVRDATLAQGPRVLERVVPEVIDVVRYDDEEIRDRGILQRKGGRAHSKQPAAPSSEGVGFGREERQRFSTTFSPRR
jgi:hypothetical protein